MQRVDDYCRRYAHLLEDVQLEERPPATSWPSPAAHPDSEEEIQADARNHEGHEGHEEREVEQSHACARSRSFVKGSRSGSKLDNLVRQD